MTWVYLGLLFSGAAAAVWAWVKAYRLGKTAQKYEQLAHSRGELVTTLQRKLAAKEIELQRAYDELDKVAEKHPRTAGVLLRDFLRRKM